MAHDDFEHIMQGRFQEFESAPPEAVWNSINAARNRRKKRVIVLWWLLPLTTAACLGMGIYWGVKTSSNTKDKTTQTNDYQNIKAIKNQFKKDSRTKNSTPSSKTKNDGNIAVDTAKNTRTINTEKAASGIASNAHSNTDPKRNGNNSTYTNDPNENLTDNIPSENKRKSGETVIPKPLDALASIPVVPLPITSVSNDLCQAYILGKNAVRRPQHAFGMRFGAFLEPSAPKKSGEVTPAEPTNFDESTFSSTNYVRSFEIQPYYELSYLDMRWRFQANALYAKSDISVNNSEQVARGIRNSMGIGIGTSYALINKRFSIHPYLHIQGELGLHTFGKTLKETSSVGSGGGGGSQSLTDPQPPTFENYRQFALAGETGLQFEYVLFRPQWSMNARAGYRNYFWEQNVAGKTTVDTPSLLHLSLGVRFTL